MADITLTNASVNSGTAVELNGAEFRQTHKNYIDVAPTPGKHSTITTDAQTVVDFLGWTNPVIVIRGVIDANNVPTNGVTVAFLKAFAKAKTDVYITETNFYPTANTSKIQIETIEFSKTKEGDTNEGRIDYTITAFETL